MRKYQLSCWSSALLSLVIIVGICDGKGVPIYSRSGTRKYINCEKNRSKSREIVDMQQYKNSSVSSFTQSKTGH